MKYEQLLNISKQRADDMKTKYDMLNSEKLQSYLKPQVENTKPTTSNAYTQDVEQDTNEVW